MIFFPVKRFNAAIEISSDFIKSAMIFKKGRNFIIKKLLNVKIPSGIVKPSFKKKNIINPDAFMNYLKESCQDLKVKRIGVALPDASVRVFIRNFTDLPGERQDQNEMVLWNISNFLNLGSEKLRVSWKNMGKNSDGSHVFLIALGLEMVMAQYENAFKKTGFLTELLAPAGLNQFNFYSKVIPEKGCVAYLSLFDEFLNIFVFSDNIPVFYKLIKKGLLSDDGSSAINDVDLLIQYYNSENPDLEIEKFYIASPIKSEDKMSRVLRDTGSIDFTIIDEKQLIDFDKNSKINFKNNGLPFYTPVLGAAQSL